MTKLVALLAVLVSFEASADAPSGLVPYVANLTGAAPRTIGAKLDERVSVKDFGAVGNNVADDTKAIQAAGNAAISDGLGELHVPAGKYRISSPIVFASPLMLVGDGPGKTVIRQTNPNANGIDFNFASLLQGGGIRGIAVEAGKGWMAGGSQGSGSSGIGIKVTNSNGKFYASDIAVHNFNTAIAVYGSFYTSWRNFELLYSAAAGILIDRSATNVGAGNSFSLGKLSNFGFAGDNGSSIGIEVIASGGDYFSFLDATRFNNGVVVRPTAGKHVLYQFFANVLADTSASDNWVIDATNDKVYSVECDGCWGAYSTRGAGLVTKGSHLDSVRWVGGRLRENGLQGWSHQGGVNADLVGVEIASNSKLVANSYDGVLVAAGVSSWALEDCRIGNFASGLSGQANGITIAAGGSQSFRIIGNDLSKPGPGKVPIANGSSSTNYVIARNLPLQTVGTNTSDRVGLSGGSGGTPGSGGTFYLGGAGSFSSPSANPFIAVKPGLATGFVVSTSKPPGAGESYRYTVFRNGMPTDLTGIVSGASSHALVVTNNAFAVAPNDQIALQLVTSAGAAPAFHSFSIYLEP